VAITTDRGAFAPSTQLSSPVQQRSTTDASLVEVLLEREDRMRQEAKMERAGYEAKADKLRGEMEAKAVAERDELRQEMEKMRKDLTPAPPAQAISEPQVAALQKRLEAVHAAKLLGDDELYALEDMVADFVEYESSMGVVTLETICTNENASKLQTLVALSERIAADGAFARQARRKYV
jgi:hypothetical protein